MPRHLGWGAQLIAPGEVALTTYMWVSIHMHMYKCTHIHICMYEYVFIYVHIHSHTCTHACIWLSMLGVLVIGTLLEGGRLAAP